MASICHRKLQPGPWVSDQSLTRLRRRDQRFARLYRLTIPLGIADKGWAETQGSCPEEAHHPSIHFTDTPKERDHSPKLWIPAKTVRVRPRREIKAATT